jgi:hypothetical protein
MTAYPYPESERYPDDAVHESYRALYNTRRYDEATVTSTRMLDPLSGARVALFAVADESHLFDDAELTALDLELVDTLWRETSATIVSGPGEREVDLGAVSGCDQACRVRDALGVGATHALAVVITGFGSRCALSGTVDDVETSATATVATVDTSCDPEGLADAVVALVHELAPPMVSSRR